MFLLFSLFLLIDWTSADDWPMSSLDYSGSRHQKDSTFRKNNVGFMVEKWFRPNPIYVLNQPIIVDDYVYYGDFTGAYAGVNITNGGTIWSVSLIGPVSNGAFVSGDYMYVCTIAGFCYKLNRFTGSTIWVSGQPNPVWSTPLLIGDKLYVSSNPSEDTVSEIQLRTTCCQKRASLRVLDEATGTLITETFWIPNSSFINVTVPLPNVYDGLGSNTTFQYGPSGAATWGDLTYNPELGLIFAAT